MAVQSCVACVRGTRCSCGREHDSSIRTGGLVRLITRIERHGSNLAIKSPDLAGIFGSIDVSIEHKLSDFPENFTGDEGVRTSLVGNAYSFDS